MRVLGLSPLDKDATAAFVEDGRILFAAGEERFSRVKQHAGFPRRAIEAGLAFTGWQARDVDAVAYAFLPAQREAELIGEALADEARFAAEFRAADPAPLLAAAEARVPSRNGPVHGLREPNQRMTKGAALRLAYRLGGVGPLSGATAQRFSRRWAAQAVADHRRWQHELEAGLRELGLLESLQRSDHHLAHAAGAWLLSGLPRGLGITLDRYGTRPAGPVSPAGPGP